MQTKKLLYFGALLLGIHFCITGGNAATIIWTGAEDGVSWNSANNWSNSIAPAAVDDAVITGIATNVTITISSSVTIQSVQCSASLNVSGGNLSLTKGPSQVIGNFTVAANRSLTVSGTNSTNCL